MPAARARPVVEGALLAALTALLGLLAFYTGFGWLQPIPILVAYQRHGGRIAVLALCVAVAVLALWTGPLAAAGSLGFVLALGVAPGWALRRGVGAGGVVAVMTAALLAVGALGYAAATWLWHQDLWGQAWKGLHTLLATRSPELRQLGLDPGTVEHLVRVLLPVALVLAAGAEAAGVYALSGSVLARLGHPLPSLPPFALWRAPRWLLAVYAGSLLLALLGERRHDQVMAALAWNLLAAGAVAYTVVGLAVTYGWLRGRGWPRARAAVGTAAAAWLLSAVGLGAALPALGLAASHWPRLAGR
jgi:uncharacterized protein YybS (DUF2232 family)